MKVFDRRKFDSDDEELFLSLVRREAAIRERVAPLSPHVPAFHSVHLDVDVDRAVIESEFIHGETFSSSLAREGPMSPARVVGLLLPLCDVLEALHEAEVIYRNLALGTVMVLDGEGSQQAVKLVDFWIAQDLDDPILPRAGTPGYAAPEQYEGQPLDPRTDVFSLAVVAYELLTGREPWWGGSPMSDVGTVLDLQRSRLTGTLGGDPIPLHRWDPDIPSELENVILKAMGRKPATRFQTVAELRERLERSI